MSRQSSLVEDRISSDDDEFQEERSGIILNSGTINKLSARRHLPSPPSEAAIDSQLDFCLALLLRGHGQQHERCYYLASGQEPGRLNLISQIGPTQGEKEGGLRRRRFSRTRGGGGGECLERELDLDLDECRAIHGRNGRLTRSISQNYIDSVDFCGRRVGGTQSLGTGNDDASNGRGTGRGRGKGDKKKRFRLRSCLIQTCLLH